VRLVLNGRGGKVGRVLGPALEGEGHELVELPDADAMVDFTAPEAVEPNVRAALERGIPCVIGTSGFEHAAVDQLARERGVACFHAPNFAIGAVLMMRLAIEAAKVLPRAEIVELHNEAKRDTPSGTAKATAAAIGGDPAIHSVRLPGLVAHQEVLFGGDGQLLTIRHDAYSREAYVPGILLALEKLPQLPVGLTVGLEAILDLY
jgi:4-hydroxy-tetrahydrodipicolinate reductase